MRKKYSPFKSNYEFVTKNIYHDALNEEQPLAIAAEMNNIELVTDVLREFRRELDPALISVTLDAMIARRSIEVAMLIYYHDPETSYNQNQVSWFRQLDNFLRMHNLNNFTAIIGIINSHNNFFNLAPVHDDGALAAFFARGYNLGFAAHGQIEGAVVGGQVDTVWLETLDSLLDDTAVGNTESSSYSIIGSLAVISPGVL